MSTKITVAHDDQFHLYIAGFNDEDFFLEVETCHECHNRVEVCLSRAQWRQIAEAILKENP